MYTFLSDPHFQRIYGKDWTKQMDIARLPVTPLARPGSAPGNTGKAGPATVMEVVEIASPRQHSRAPVEKVVQGELLQRERTPYQSTRSFLDERALDQARPADQQGQPPHRSRSAVSQYLNHVRPETGAELTQGQSVNFFV